jgi:hypothetical protein
MTPNQLLVKVGREKRVLSLKGQPHAIIQAACQRHADYQARRLTAGHQGWDGRLAWLNRMASNDARGFRRSLRSILGVEHQATAGGG